VCEEKPIDDTLYGYCSVINCRKKNMTKLSAIDGDWKSEMGCCFLFCLFACNFMNVVGFYD
jgi:hypothetical protein